MWAETIRRDLVAGTASFISAGRKLIKAKQALEETNESFTHLVTVELGYDLDTAERWMTIARHPVLSDSATVADSLPTSWTTLYALSQIPPELLRQYIADGTVHPGLTYRAAVQLKNGSSDRSADADGGGDPGDVTAQISARIVKARSSASWRGSRNSSMRLAAKRFSSPATRARSKS
jgi:hypothetical protein